MFEWKDQYNTGIKEIDSQHKQFFIMGEEMNQIIISYSGEDIHEKLYDIFIRLIEYSIYHFEAEETLMEESNYPELDAHRKRHHHFINKLHAIDLKQLKGDQGIFAYDLLKTIASWITKHIEGDDMKYVPYIVKDL